MTLTFSTILYQNFYLLFVTCATISFALKLFIFHVKEFRIFVAISRRKKNTFNSTDNYRRIISFLIPMLLSETFTENETYSRDSQRLPPVYPPKSNKFGLSGILEY